MTNAEAWDEEEPEEPSAADAPWSAAEDLGQSSRTSLALGLVALAPLFLAYEFGLSRDAQLPRTLSESTLFRIFGTWPQWQTGLRQATLAGALLVAAGVCFYRRMALFPSLLRIFLEGCLGAVVLGPALAYGMRLWGGFDAQWVTAVGDTSLPIAARVLGGAAFEELLFRVGIFSLCFLFARRGLAFFGAGLEGARWGAEALALIVSSLCFAAIHVAPLAPWLGAQGEVWDAAVFLWRALAGVLLALLYRWRGLGVAAWSHGLFNLAVLLGAGPEVLL